MPNPEPLGARTRLATNVAAPMACAGCRPHARPTLPSAVLSDRGHARQFT